MLTESHKASAVHRIPTKRDTRQNSVGTDDMVILYPCAFIFGRTFLSSFAAVIPWKIIKVLARRGFCLARSLGFCPSESTVSDLIKVQLLFRRAHCCVYIVVDVCVRLRRKEVRQLQVSFRLLSLSLSGSFVFFLFFIIFLYYVKV